MAILKKLVNSYSFILLIILAACGDSGSEPGPDDPQDDVSLSERNLLRAMELTDSAVSAHFTGAGMTMARYYNPYTDVRSNEIGSIWMYTSAIEAVNAIIHSLQVQNEKGNPMLYDEHFRRYTELLSRLYENAEFYLGTFELVSYTQTKEWSIYGVNRGSGKGTANVAGVLNVYDDQMWFIRELLSSYKLTGEEAYLEKAEYLTEYVLDGWDCTFNASGEERGGITWGPGYVTKHSPSNAPQISPLVWLHEIYKDKSDEITHRYIDPSDKETRDNRRAKQKRLLLILCQKNLRLAKGGTTAIGWGV